MLIPYLLIVVFSGAVLFAFRKDYFLGLQTALFFLVILPEALCFEFGSSIPSMSVNRIILLISAFFWFKNSNRHSLLKERPFIRNLTLIAAAAAISVLISADLLISLKRYFYFLFESLLFFCIVATSIRNRPECMRIMIVVSVALLVVALLGTVERYTDFNPTVYLNVKKDFAFRAGFLSAIQEIDSGVTATYEHRILFGIGMALSMLYGIFFFLATSGWKRYIGLAGVCFFAMNLFFSFSRGPWLGFSVALLFGCLIRPVKIGKVALLLVLLTLVVFAMRPGTLNTLEAYYTSTFDPNAIKGSSFRWRFIVLDMASHSIMESRSLMRMAFGFGQGSHHFLQFPEVTLSSGYVVQMNSWDMEFAVALLEQGFIGLVLILLLYARIFAKGLTRFYYMDEEGKLLLGAALQGLVLFIFAKTNVKIFASQLVYGEFILMAIASYLIAEFDGRRYLESK